MLATQSIEEGITDLDDEWKINYLSSPDRRSHNLGETVDPGIISICVSQRTRILWLDWPSKRRASKEALSPT